MGFVASDATVGEFGLALTWVSAIMGMHRCKSMRPPLFAGQAGVGIQLTIRKQSNYLFRAQKAQFQMQFLWITYEQTCVHQLAVCRLPWCICCGQSVTQDFHVITTSAVVNLWLKDITCVLNSHLRSINGTSSTDKRRLE